MEPTEPIAGVVTGYLAYFLVPLWLAAGVLDWWCHRRAGIEHTTGPKESVLHLLMLVEIGIPVLLVLLFEVNAMVIAVALIALAAHTVTSAWDVRFAASRREISTLEQHAHSVLEMLPLMALSCLVFLHWSDFLALIGLGGEADFALKPKRDPLPSVYVVSLLAAAVAFQLVPYTEELWRGLKTARTFVVPSAR